MSRAVVIEAAKVTDLVELATVKTRLGITGSGDDAALAEYIAEVSSAFVEYVRRPLARQKYSETTFGTDTTSLALSRAPLETGAGRLTLTIDGTAQTDFSVLDHEAGILYREDGFPRNADPDVVATYYAGYLMPGQVSTWSTAATFELGAWARATAANASHLRFEATTAGTTHASVEPTWPTTAGSTVTDGTVVWTARAAYELPEVLRQLAFFAVRDAWSERDRAAGLQRRTIEGISETYFGSDAGGHLSTAVERGLSSFRWAH